MTTGSRRANDEDGAVPSPVGVGVEVRRRDRDGQGEREGGGEDGAHADHRNLVSP